MKVQELGHKFICKELVFGKRGWHESTTSSHVDLASTNSTPITLLSLQFQSVLRMKLENLRTIKFNLLRNT